MDVWRSAAVLLLSLLSVNCEDAAEKVCPQLSLTYTMAVRAETNTCYQFYYGKKTWKDARTYCNQFGGHLVTINDQATFTFIRNVLNGLTWRETEFWIGLNDLDHELSWKWVQNKGDPSIPLIWSNWHEDHPQGWFHGYRDCIKMKKDDGDWTWHEVTCNTYPWVYRFICQYEATGEVPTDNSQNSANVNGHVQTSASTSRPRTTLDDISTLLTGSEEGNYGNRNMIGGEHRRVTGSDSRSGSSSMEGDPNHAAVRDGDDEDDAVPLYAVIISFGAGVLFACAIILFVVIRRRRRKKEQADAYPTVVYQAQPAVEAGVSGGAVGAVGPPIVCSLSGKPCKIAVTSGSQKCTCNEEHEVVVSGPGRSKHACANSNVYVRVDDVDYRRGGMTRDPVSDLSEPGPSGASSLRDMSLFDEQPPTYDEACAGIAIADAQASGRPENIYTEEPQVAVGPPADGPRQQDDSHQRSEPREDDQNNSSVARGAIPKMAPTAAYVPMNGSPKPTSHNRTNSSNTYVPMLGELPPIPTDQGYEIPVASRLEPEALKSMQSPEEEGAMANNRMSAIYAEIPDRNSRLLRHKDEEIYQTID